MCEPIRTNTPFCDPHEGVQLFTGDVVEVTWNPTLLTNPNNAHAPLPRRLRLQAEFADQLGDDTFGGTDGFTSESFDAAAGLFTWSILDSFLGSSIANVTVTLSLVEPPNEVPLSAGRTSTANSTTPARRFSGPSVHVVRRQMGGSSSNNNNDNNNNNAISSGNTNTNINGNGNGNGSNGNNAAAAGLNNNSVGGNTNGMGASGSSLNSLAIALPVVFGVLTLVLMGGYVMWKRRHPDFRLRDAVGRFWNRTGRGGYGERMSRGQRLGGKEIKVVTTDMNGLRLNAMRMRSAMDEEMGRAGTGKGVGGGVGGRGGGDGRNVFREEVRRLDRSRV